MLFQEDVEAPRLQHLPGVEEMLQQLVQYHYPQLVLLYNRYQEKLAEICKNLTDAGLKEKEVWDKERGAIFSSHLEAKANNQKEAVAIIQQYEDTKQSLISAGDIEKALAHLNTILDEMKHDLIKLEMILVEQLDVSCSQLR